MKDEMDILKEVGNTAAAHGSIALSEILGRKISLTLPSMRIISQKELSKEMHIEGMVLTTQASMLSGIRGKMIFVLEEESAFKLVDLCYETTGESKKISLFTEMGMSIIKEVGNIIISTYISSLSLFTKKLIITSFPVLINAPFADVINMLVIDSEKENYLLIIEASFQETEKNIKGKFWLALTSEAAEEIKRICKKLLESI